MDVLAIVFLGDPLQQGFAAVILEADRIYRRTVIVQLLDQPKNIPLEFAIGEQEYRVGFMLKNQLQC